MAKTKTKRKSRNGEATSLPRSGSSARPRWRILPPEIIRMILQYLEIDKETLRACSHTAHDFRHVAQSFLGRHIRVNDVNRLKQCARLISRGAFQHVRSLDLGADKKGVILEEYWKDYLVILGSFSRYRTLSCLWLSEVPFTFTRPGQKKNLRETVIALGSTTTELGLYGCHFSSYEEMISLIRSFPLCKYLFIRNCVTGERATGRNALAGLPEHTLAIKDLQLSTASPASPSNVLIDISNLIEDAALDVGSLTSLVCDVVTFEGTQRVAAAVSASRVEHFQMACLQPEGFQAFVGHFSGKWALKSLTIGPQRHQNTGFWEEAFKDLPPFPCVDKVTIIYHYPRPGTIDIDCWGYFDRTLARRDLFPTLKSVYIRVTYGSYLFDGRMRWTIWASFRSLRAMELGLHWYSAATEIPEES